MKHKPTNIIREVADEYQGLFNLMSKEYNLTLTISEMDEIISEAEKVKRTPEPSIVQLSCFHNLTSLRKIGDHLTCLDCQTTWKRI